MSSKPVSSKPAAKVRASPTQWTAHDRALGMHRQISRRDVLHGLALAGSGALAGGFLASAAMAADGPSFRPAGTDTRLQTGYPPEWTGMRGSTDGTFETAHAARDGKSWDGAADSGETYDLIVVGAGISGLAAAHFYRTQTSPMSRILILDNHDDFGGHARRNEFHLDGHLYLLNGGTSEIDSPRPYSATADGLLRSLGIDVEKIAAAHPNSGTFHASEAERGMFFDRETFGADKLLVGRNGRSWVHFLDEAPLNSATRAAIWRIEQGNVDYLHGMSSADKKALLSTISYRAYLRDYAKADAQALAFYDSRANNFFAVGIDAVSALDFWGTTGNDAPGMRGLKLEPGGMSRMSYTAQGYASTGGSYQFHFPDGNATIARLLVRALIPAVAPPGSVEQMVATRFDYSQVDRAASPVRLRLGSTVVRARNIDSSGAAAGAADSGSVELTYVRDGRPVRVRGRHCVLACYNMIIPYLCPELPQEQKNALHELVKSPLVYTSVAIRSSRAFHKLGIRQIDAPGSYHPLVYLNPSLAIGDYRVPTNADKPALIHMERTPCKPGLTEADQNRAGRAELLATPYETIERNIRDQLGRMLGAAGFDPARDITAITVNRWPHGYAPEYNALFDRELPVARQPHVIGRARFGRIAIANSDSGGGAYTDIAIDQGHRAVRELLEAGAA